MLQMNCQLFDVIAGDLVRGQLADERLTARAQEHAAACPACADRLQALKSLADGLKAVAAVAAQEEPPREIEQRLRARFRQQCGSPVAEPVRLARRVTPAWMRRRWLAVAAAAMLTAAAAILWQAEYHGRSSRAEVVTRVARAPHPETREDGSGKVRASQPGVSQSRSVRVANETASASDGGFIVLPYAEDAPPLNNAQMITVRLAASDLTEIGLPAPALPSQQYVTADVLIGDDGIARAIRVDQ